MSGGVFILGMKNVLVICTSKKLLCDSVNLDVMLVLYSILMINVL